MPKKRLKFMQKYLTIKIQKILVIFLIWKLILLFGLIIALNFIPLADENRFLGGGLKNYLQLPQILAWANFDGEHYLSIAIFGYKGLEQAFFPIYPKLIFLLAHPFYQNQLTSDLFPALFYSTFFGLFLSHLSLLLGLFILWDLLRLDYSQKISLLTLVLILAFPTSFYLGAVYSESIYLLVSVTAFYLARKKRWFLASIMGVLASATRIFGILLLPAFLLEIWQTKESLKKAWWVILIPLGLLSYMFYQYLTLGDPLAFYHLQKIVGEQHQSGLTLLPQVYYRYLKMVSSVDIYNPIYQTIILEFITGILFFILPIIGYFKKVRLSYLFYSLAGFLLPTIQGSFSSVPRYILAFFPSFLVMAILLNKKSLWIEATVVSILVLILIVETVLFLRGYWIA